MKSISDDRIIKLPEVKQLTTLCSSSIYQMMKEGRFPKSIPLGGRAVGWRYSSVMLWIEQQEESVAVGGN